MSSTVTGVGGSGGSASRWRDARRGDLRRHRVGAGLDELVHAVRDHGVPEGQRVGQQAQVDKVLLDLLDLLAGLDDELDLPVAAAGGRVEAIAELRGEQVGDQRAG